MPLLKGSSKEVVSENIREMRNAGHPEDQAVAASLRMARESGGGSSKSSRKPLKFHKGGLHASTSTAPGKKISASKHAAAASGKFGPKAEKQERFYENVLK